MWYNQQNTAETSKSFVRSIYTMGFWDFSLKPQLSEEELKANKFAEFDGGNPETSAQKKASWLTSRGNRFGTQNRFDDAIRDFKEAIAIDKDWCPAYLGLSVAYRVTGRYSDAFSTLEKAPHEQPGETPGTNDFDIYNARCAIYVALGRYDLALHWGRMAIAAYSNPGRMGRMKWAVDAGVVECDDSLTTLNMLKELTALISEELQKSGK